MVVLALSGALGHERDWHASAGGVELQVHAPAVIRNGEFLETQGKISFIQRDADSGTEPPSRPATDEESAAV